MYYVAFTTSIPHHSGDVRFRCDYHVATVFRIQCIRTSRQTDENGKVVQGFDETVDRPEGIWVPYSDKKVRVGIAGYGFCQFGAHFFFQNHPNVECVAAADLFKDRAEGLARSIGAKRIYLSAEEMMDKEKGNMDAIFIATDAPSHVSLAIRALDRGYHVASCVPALFGEEQLDQAEKLIEAVKKSGRVYSLFETTAFRPQAIAMRRLYKAGAFGKMVYSEGEYQHFSDFNNPFGSHNGWRIGLPPQYYPTHSNGFYTCVTGGSFTEVTCVGTGSPHPVHAERKNRYKNPFATEVAFFKTSEGGSARMIVGWNWVGPGGEKGRTWGTKGCYIPAGETASANDRYQGDENLVKGLNLKPNPLPPGVEGGGHGGSHGHLTDDFIRAILVKDHKVCCGCDVIGALNTTVAGVYAHMSALKDGELLKIPQFEAF